MSRDRRSLARLVVGLVILVTGCTSRPAKVTVDRVLVDVPAALDARAADRDQIRLQVGDALGEDATVRFRPGEKGATHLVRLTLAVETPGRWLLDVALQSLGDGESYGARATGDASVELVPTVMGLFSSAWKLVERERTLDREKTRALIATLEGEYDPQLRAFIVARLGDRKATEAVEPLIALLETEKHTDVQLRAVGALVAIGDRRAIEPLIQLAEHRPPDFVVPLVYAVARLGGPTAEGYLVTLASGHPSAVVREAAESALGEMRRLTGTDKSH